MKKFCLIIGLAALSIVPASAKRHKAYGKGPATFHSKPLKNDSFGDFFFSSNHHNGGLFARLFPHHHARQGRSIIASGF